MPAIYNILLPECCINLSTKQSGKTALSDQGYLLYNIKYSQLSQSKLQVNQSWHKEKYGFNLSESEIDIFLMHRLAWTSFIQSGDNYCAIVEGNGLVLESPIPNLETLNLSHENWDVLFPFGEREVLATKDALEKRKLINYNCRERKEYESYLLGRKWGSFIYFLTQEGAGKLLRVKEITQNVDDEILLLSYEGQLNVYSQKFRFFNYANRPQILNLDREKEIYSAIMTNNVWKRDTINMARDLLTIVTSIAYKLNIDLILEGGTLLGYIQHDGLMPWDDDIDLGIYYKDVEKLLSEINKIERIKMDEFSEERNGIGFYKIWGMNGIMIEDQPYTFPFIDLWPYDIIGDDIQFLNGVICTNAASRKFIDVIFEGSMLKIPFNAVRCLNERYKTWKETIRVYQWSHQQEGNTFHPLTVKIKTDRNGRMIAPLFQLLANSNCLRLDAK